MGLSCGRLESYYFSSRSQSSVIFSIQVTDLGAMSVWSFLGLPRSALPTIAEGSEQAGSNAHSTDRSRSPFERTPFTTSQTTRSQMDQSETTHSQQSEMMQDDTPPRHEQPVDAEMGDPGAHCGARFSGWPIFTERQQSLPLATSPPCEVTGDHHHRAMTPPPQLQGPTPPLVQSSPAALVSALGPLESSSSALGADAASTGASVRRVHWNSPVQVTVTSPTQRLVLPFSALRVFDTPYRFDTAVPQTPRVSQVPRTPVGATPPGGPTIPDQPQAQAQAPPAEAAQAPPGAAAGGGVGEGGAPPKAAAPGGVGEGGAPGQPTLFAAALVAMGNRNQRCAAPWCQHKVHAEARFGGYCCGLHAMHGSRHELGFRAIMELPQHGGRCVGAIAGNGLPRALPIMPTWGTLSDECRACAFGTDYTGW